jgi:hypothetical protein
LHPKVIYSNDEFALFAGSRTRWLTTEDDNYGFAKWCLKNAEDLMQLGVGRHFGEYWGQGCQRNYGLKEKRLSLFNVSRWCLHGTAPALLKTDDPRIEKYQDVLPACVGLVPILYQGVFDMDEIWNCLHRLQYDGSVAAPGFMDAEGIVIWHSAANKGFKKTLKHDDEPKSVSKRR